MTLDSDDILYFDNKSYIIMGHNLGAKAYWVQEQNVVGYFPFMWSESFIEDNLKTGRMTVRRKGSTFSHCYHVYEQKPSFRFVYDVCIKCGDTKNVDWTKIK